MNRINIEKKKHDEIVARHYDRLDGLRALLQTVEMQDVYDVESIKDLRRKIAYEERQIQNMTGELTP